MNWLNFDMTPLRDTYARDEFAPSQFIRNSPHSRLTRNTTPCESANWALLYRGAAPQVLSGARLS